MFQQIEQGNKDILFADHLSSNHKETVEKFAQDKQAFKDAYGDAFVKLSEWGHDDLTSLSQLGLEHQDIKLIAREF